MRVFVIIYLEKNVIANVRTFATTFDVYAEIITWAKECNYYEEWEIVVREKMNDEVSTPGVYTDMVAKIEHLRSLAHFHVKQIDFRYAILEPSTLVNVTDGNNNIS